MDSKFLSASPGGNSGAYTDLNRLAHLKNGAGRDSQANIRQVAEEFESLFINEMLKSMRAANNVFAKDNYLNSSTTQQYQEMYDQQLAVDLSTKGHGIGLSDVLVRQLSAKNSRSQPVSSSAPIEAPNAKALPWPEAGRDDSKLLNARRLALPSRLTERVLAGIVPDTQTTQPLANKDWRAAQAYTADSTRRYAQPPMAAGKSAFDSQEDFIATMLPLAQKAAEQLGVDPRYLVAQAALETGWGKSIILDQDGSSSHNLFGIKTGSRWQGESARALTSEYQDGQKVKEVANFRSYASFEQSFLDYVSFLQNNGRYQEALDSASSPEQFMQELQRAGYATDPNYARKVSQIARQMQVYQTVAETGSRPLG